jgi:16S rRNA (guanine1207-N2)-methyltransferase
VTDRLSLALAAGAVSAPPGPALLLRPPGDAGLDALPGPLHAVQGFRPDHDALAARGVAVTPGWPPAPDGGAFAGAVLWLPRARALAESLLARACAMLPAGAPVLVTGAKSDGVEALLRRLRRHAAVSEPFSKAHGKVFSFPAAPLPPDWGAPLPPVEGFRVAPGVFSADGPDAGSRALLAAVPPLAGRGCDLGAGWGFLAARLLARDDGIAALDLVEAEHDALDCARVNVADPRAAHHWADARAWEGGPYDFVVTNPPFHASRAADPDLGRAFVAAGARVLDPGGRLFLVANRHLPYETALTDAFSEVVTLSEGGGYKVLQARRPRGNRRAAARRVRAAPRGRRA